MMITAEMQKLVPDALIELYELRPPASVNMQSMRFTGSGNGQPLTFQGLLYEAWAVEGRGYESKSRGAPRPKLSISNLAQLPDGREVRGVFTALVRQHQGLVGWTVVRRLTYAKFLAGGELEGAPEMHPEEIWIINRRISDNGSVIVFELRSALDMAGRAAPGVLVTRYCPAHVTYRGPDCGYQGAAMFDAHNKPVTDIRLDACCKTVQACRLRDNLSNYAGCPGMRRYS
ncbi:phage minor tail protein L [Chromobacterium haemolyticum]|uniref:phage minor tail protein L n=1 Tax=Chromobacterium haemolyticum TaxID=394935 RepID=UPI0009DB0953|nr:phage minor tail protein L [Chromobacterium haemolyticum]OQS41815.1 phage minor tail protein L [Chromobacterium haemolyticum]